MRFNGHRQEAAGQRHSFILGEYRALKISLQTALLKKLNAPGQCLVHPVTWPAFSVPRNGCLD